MSSKKKQYNICTGWHRGGTSLLMLALKQAGIPIVGFKYPFQFSFDYVNRKSGKIVKQKVQKDGGLLEPLKEVREHNPTGFWEVPSICLEKGLQEEHRDIGFDGDVIKVPSRVFPSCNPDLVDKVIIILRDPAKVIASQLKCTPQKDKKKYIKVASLGMLYNMLMCEKWIEKHKKDYHITYYEDLIKKNSDELSEICFFMSRGDHAWGEMIVDRKLDRSEPIESNCKELKMIKEYYTEGKHWKEYDLDDIKKQIVELDKKGEKITNL